MTAITDPELAETAFLQRLAEAIAKAPHTQAAIAEQIGIRPATISGWLNDQKMPGSEALIHLPGVLGADGHWLLTGEGERELTKARRQVDDRIREGGRLALGEVELLLKKLEARWTNERAEAIGERVGEYATKRREQGHAKQRHRREPG